MPLATSQVPWYKVHWRYLELSELNLKRRIRANSTNENIMRHLQVKRRMPRHWTVWGNTHFSSNKAVLFCYLMMFPYCCVTPVHQLTPQLCCSSQCFHGHHTKCNLLNAKLLHIKASHYTTQAYYRMKWDMLIIKTIFYHLKSTMSYKCGKIWIPEENFDLPYFL